MQTKLLLVVNDADCIVKLQIGIEQKICYDKNMHVKFYAQSYRQVTEPRTFVYAAIVLMPKIHA